MTSDHLLDWPALFQGWRERASGLVLVGPPGIGKTHRLEEGISHAADSGWRVLRARPAESESRLAGSVLIDLLADVGDGEMDALPPVQRDALAAALLRGTSAQQPDARVVHVATAHLFGELAAAGPVLVVVDDAHWLDAETASVLAFTVRRLPRSAFALLATVRDGGRDNELTVALREVGAPRIEVAPLAPAAVEQLLHERFGGGALTPSAVAHVVAVSGGNPYYALELGKAMQYRDDDAEPLPSSLQHLVQARLSGLRPAELEAVAAAAALRRPTTRHLDRLGLGAGLPQAERAGIVSVHDGGIRFSHPLLAEGAYALLTGSEREALHRRLAEVVTDVEERARHLVLGAAGADGSDEQVLATLDSAVERALVRGATHAAIETARLAVRASPADTVARNERRMRLAVLLFRSGDAAAAAALLGEVIAWAEHRQHADPGRDTALLTARAHWHAATVARQSEGIPAAVAHATRALRGADLHGDTDLRIDCHLLLARMTYQDAVVSLDHARRALALLDASAHDDPARRAVALVAVGLARFKVGDGLDEPLFEDAVALESGVVTGGPVADSAAATFAALLVDCGMLVRARALLDELERRCAEVGDDGSLPVLLGHRVKLELWSGHLPAGERAAAQHVAQAARTAQANEARNALRSTVMCRLYRGEYDQALTGARELIEAGAADADGFVEMMGRGLAGEALLGLGDSDSAVVELRAAEALRQDGATDPAWSRWSLPLAEALLACGRTDEAQVVLTDLEQRARRADRRLALAGCARARARLSAAHDFDGALRLLDRALSYFDDPAWFPVDHAHTLLVRGVVLRRGKQKAAAREALEQAAAIAERIGADGLAARVTAELNRLGRRTAAATELTETERQVAELAAAGQRVADIAGALFLSPKTVEANLTRIYRKLDVRNRAELVLRMTRGSPDS